MVADNLRLLHSRHNVPGVLDKLVEVGDLPPLLELVQEVHLQVPQLVADAHEELVVALGR